MTIKEFQKLLREDQELREKYRTAKKDIKVSDEKEQFAALSKLAKDLGYDIPASEFNLEKIGSAELNEEELEMVAGGRGGVECQYDFEDTDCFIHDFCDGPRINYTIHTCLYKFDDSFCVYSDKCRASYMVYK